MSDSARMSSVSLLHAADGPAKEKRSRSSNSTQTDKAVQRCMQYRPSTGATGWPVVLQSSAASRRRSEVDVVQLAQHRVVEVIVFTELKLQSVTLHPASIA